MKKLLIKSSIVAIVAMSACLNANETASTIEVKNIAQNPEGIEYDKSDNTFLLSSLNAKPIIKVKRDGTFTPFTKGEKFPLSTTGLQIDTKHNRLLVAGFNGTEIMDKDPKTKGASFLRVYDLKSGELKKSINLSSLAPNANAYFANDIAVDNEGNAYIPDWYANVIYKVNLDGKAELFWKNSTNIKGTPNGLDFNKDGYLLVSLLSVDKKGHYVNYGLVKIDIKNPKNTTVVDIKSDKFRGFDGMVINSKGNVIGVTNDGKGAGGNMLIELSSNNNYKSAKVENYKAIKPSTTVALDKNENSYVINQDFSDNFKKNWVIQKVK